VATLKIAEAKLLCLPIMRTCRPRAVASGAPFTERVDLLAKPISHQLGMPYAVIDQTVQTADQKLNEEMEEGGSSAE